MGWLSICQRILLVFGKDEAITIKQITELFLISRTAVTFHLNILEKAGLIQRQSVGREVYCRLEAKVLIQSLQKVLAYVKEENLV